MVSKTSYLSIEDERTRKKQARCSHRRLRTTWSASHLSQPGFGGYFQIGVFDTTLICTDCGLEWLLANKDLPLCQKCLTSMAMVQSDTVGVEAALERFKAKQKRDWQTYCARMERIENELERRRPPREQTGDTFARFHQMQVEMHEPMVRILQGSSRQQIWPYYCNNPTCVKYHTLKFLHTPGD